jgi:protein arginine N-methyltransferase 1
VLIPLEDELVVSLLEAEDLREKVLTPWVSPVDGFDLSAGLPAVTSGVHQDKVALTRAQLLTEPKTWATITYGGPPPPVVAGRVTVQATRSGTAHGIALWFDAKLAPGVSFTNAPGSTAIYGRSICAFPHPVSVEAGDLVCVDIVARKTADDYLWSIATAIGGAAGKPRSEFRQSSWATLPSRRALPGRARLGKRGRVALEVLRAMNGTAELSAIVDRVFAQFPETFGADRGTAAALVQRIVADYADFDSKPSPNRER